MSSSAAGSGSPSGSVSEHATLFGTQDFADDKATVRRLLEQKLPAEYLSTRVGAGKSRFTYVESWRAIEIANSIFGFDGWSSSVITVTPDFVEQTGGKYKCGVTALVRVTLKNGSYHEDVGFGMSENRCQGSAIENAKKEAVSDARKRALRVFGNALGNSVYDRDYIDSVKVPQKKGLSPVSYDQVRKGVTVSLPPSTTPMAAAQRIVPQIVPKVEQTSPPQRQQSSVAIAAVPSMSPTPTATSSAFPPMVAQQQPQKQPDEYADEFPLDPAILDQLQFDESELILGGGSSGNGDAQQQQQDVQGEPPNKRPK